MSTLPKFEPRTKMGDVEKLRYDALRSPLARKTPEEVSDWIDANVNDLSTAKVVLKEYGQALSAIVHHLKQNKAV